MDSRIFSERDFACKCCGENNIDERIISMTQRIQDSLGLPVSVVSGYRCKVHNAIMGGARRSYHTQGLAVDLTCVKDINALWHTIQTLWHNGELPELSCAIRDANYVHIDCGKKRKHVFEVRAV